jgi:hypothetical protein
MAEPPAAAAARLPAARGRTNEHRDFIDNRGAKVKAQL